MSSINSTSDIVRPEFFIIRGIPEGPYMNYFNFFLFFCYAASLLGNLFLITIISVVRSLHKPKYMAVFNLAVSDLGESTALIPKLMEIFFFNIHQISYEACLISMFFALVFFAMESVTLTILAYDRFVAIRFPLRYHSIVTNTSMGIIITVAWIFVSIITALMMLSITTLSFCTSQEIDSFYCDYGPTCTIACNDKYFSYIIGLVCVALFYYIPISLIGLSYASILLALFKIASGKERIKALKTCTSHLILVAVFYVPLITIDTAILFTSIDRNNGLIGMAVSYTLPTVLNPIVYTLSTAEIKELVMKRFKWNRDKDVIPTVSK